MKTFTREILKIQLSFIWFQLYFSSQLFLFSIWKFFIIQFHLASHSLDSVLKTHGDVYACESKGGWVGRKAPTRNEN